MTQEYEGTNEDFHNNSLQIYRTVLGKFVMVDYMYKDCMRGFEREEQFTGFTFWLSLEKPLFVLKEYTKKLKHCPIYSNSADIKDWK